MSCTKTGTAKRKTQNKVMAKKQQQAKLNKNIRNLFSNRDMYDLYHSVSVLKGD